MTSNTTRSLQEVEDAFWEANEARASADWVFFDAVRRDPTKRPFLTAMVTCLELRQREESRTYRELHAHPEYSRHA